MHLCVCGHGPGEHSERTGLCNWTDSQNFCDCPIYQHEGDQ